MTIAQKLKERTEKIISDLETKSINLERDRPSFKSHPEKLKAYNAEREATAQALSLVHGRLPYIVKGDINYNCPKCCLLGPVRSIMNPYPERSPTKNDLWRCNTCGLEEEVLRGI